MRNKTLQEKGGSSSSDAAREERSRTADVGEAAEQSTQGSPAGKKAGRQQELPAPPKKGAARGRVTK